MKKKSVFPPTHPQIIVILAKIGIYGIKYNLWDSYSMYHVLSIVFCATPTTFMISVPGGEPPHSKLSWGRGLAPDFPIIGGQESKFLSKNV